MKHNNCGQKQNNIFKKTGLRHIIVNCQLSIVNSAKPFKHQFAARVGSMLWVFAQEEGQGLVGDGAAADVSDPGKVKENAAAVAPEGREAGNL